MSEAWGAEGEVDLAFASLSPSTHLLLLATKNL